VKRKSLVVAALLVVITAACSSSSSVNAAKESKGLKPAPDFALPGPDGQVVRLSDFKGKVVLLDFWATWCGPCKIEIPWFIEFQRQYKDQGFTVIGVSLDEGGWADIRPFMDEMKMNYPVLLGNDEMTEPFGGIEVLPTTFLIDRQGRIVDVHRGLVSKNEFEKTIKDLL
jgi:peroxiredoxin